MKKIVDNWYKVNFADTIYKNYIEDSIFCNDRTIPGKDTTGWYEDTGLGYALNITGYGVLARLGIWNSNSVKPVFTCPQKNDAFTVDDEEKGNGDLTYPIGLITADEIVAAGSGKNGTPNNSYYLYNPNSWSASLSPCCMSDNRLAYGFNIFPNGSLTTYAMVSTPNAAAPVINLKADYFKTFIGTGTMSDSFRAPGVTP